MDRPKIRLAMLILFGLKVYPHFDFLDKRVRNHNGALQDFSAVDHFKHCVDLRQRKAFDKWLDFYLV